MAETVRVTGYKEFLKACKDAPRDVRKEVRTAFRHVGDAVRADAARRFSPVDQRTAAGYRVFVRQRGVGVEQSLRKTTGKHPEFGALQMRRALIPAAKAEQSGTERALEEALGRVAHIFESR